MITPAVSSNIAAKQGVKLANFVSLYSNSEQTTIWEFLTLYKYNDNNQINGFNWQLLFMLFSNMPFLFLKYH